MQVLESLQLISNSSSDEFDFIFKDSDKLFQLFSGMKWAEGPAYINGSVILSDVKDNKMYQYSLKNGVEIYREYSNYSNGNYIDNEGRLLSCEHGRRCISRTDSEKKISILVDKYDGKRFNSPNDLVVKSDDTIWFTDPPYGIIGDVEGYKSESQIIGCYVYKYDPKTEIVTAEISDTQRPNGLAFSPREDFLYVADMSIVDFPTYGRRQIRVYDMVEGKPINGRHFAHIEPGIPDGFRVDKLGRLYISYEYGIKVIKDDGSVLGDIIVPERVSNCCFGYDVEGIPLLFITATSSLYCVTLNQDFQRS